MTEKRLNTLKTIRKNVFVLIFIVPLALLGIFYLGVVPQLTATLALVTFTGLLLLMVIVEMTIREIQ
ncbi:MAG: hypothetical protein AAFV33_12660, partial [Chloroflexota bacterium]